ncbi:hypothetical protein [Marinimicrobium agarilyticum]|uniref:hypothetical protein n=1 Tax=Marinimicrobium agarilyticum TaxID=306546 RepID=UPI00048A143A|nr:hypothetical protein [Marinimicrobium agarilyticum]
MRTIYFIVVALCSFTLNAEAVHIVDQSRDRAIPVQIYEPANQSDCTAQSKCPVAILSAGYGVSPTDYEFVVNAYATLGYLVLAVGHELPGDPPLSTSGDLYQTRIENWRRGAETLRVVVSSMKRQRQGYDFNRLTLIGHSNGGDISAWVANHDASAVDALITLDHRRVPLPKVNGLRVLSLRAGDFPADKGVIPTPEEQALLGICILEFPQALHNNMTDNGPEWLKSHISEALLKFSSGESECRN